MQCVSNESTHAAHSFGSKLAESPVHVAVCALVGGSPAAACIVDALEIGNAILAAGGVSVPGALVG